MHPLSGARALWYIARRWDELPARRCRAREVLRVEAQLLMRLVAGRLVLGTAIALGVAAWLASAPMAAAQSPSYDRSPYSLIDEVRFGVLAHNLEPSND